MAGIAKRRATEPTGNQEALAEVARRMARASSPARIVHRIDGAVDELLFDGEIAGQRYQLIRTEAAFERPILSPREQEIARLVARGLPNKAVAAVLEISLWTVSTHLRRIYAKLEVNCRAAMVAKLAETVEHSARVP
ncbi:MAG: response regulator transcription factor [Dehalococcoidia bacterium]